MHVSNVTSDGLGNILFQIASGYAYSLKHNVDYKLFSNFNRRSTHTHLYYYTKNILKNIKIERQCDVYHAKYSELGFDYNEIPKFNQNLLLYGYFQSYKYFSDHRQEILDLFYLPGDSIEECSIHVRRGDYLTLPNHHPVQSIQYYNDAMSLVNSDKYIVFSDDIDWCKENFKGKQFSFSKLDSYGDICLMSKCSNNIISNSTFSWWGSWLNTNNDKIVVAPKNWFGLSYNHYTTRDLFYPQMIVI